MRKTKFFKYVAIVVALTFTLSACGKSADETTTAAPTTEVTTTAEATTTAEVTTETTATDATTAEATTEATTVATTGDPTASLSGAEGLADKTPTTLTFYSADGTRDNPFTDDIAKEIKRLTGVTLQISYPVNGQADATIATMIASGDMPDIVYAKGGTSKFYDAGYLVKLDDYIDKDGANVKAIYGDYLKRLRYSPEDPHYYALGAYGVGSPVWNVGSAVQIQHAVLKDQGYPQLKTLDQFGEAIKAYAAKYPEIDGQKTIGMSLLADDWRWYITVSNPANFAAGYPDNGQWLMNSQTGEAQYKFLNPSLKEFYKWVNKLNSEGLLDPDSFTQKYDQYIAKLSSGRVLAIADAKWEYQNGEKALLAANKPERCYAILPTTINESTKSAAMTDFGYSAGWGVAITTKCKDPEKAFQFINWLASDYAQVLNNWGINGQHYDYIDGKRVWKPEVLQMYLTDSDFGLKTGMGLYGYPFPQRGDAQLDPTGNPYTTTSIQSIIDNYNAGDKETLAAYGVEMYKDLFPPSSEFPVPPFGAAWQLTIPSDSDLSITLQNADKYCQGALPQLMLVDPAKFDAGWDNIQSELKKMGIDQANADMTKLAQDKMNFWK